MMRFAQCGSFFLLASLAQAAPITPKGSDESLFRAFEHFCVATEVRFSKIEEVIASPSVQIRNRQDFQGERTSTWMLAYNGRTLAVKAHTGRSEFVKRSIEYCDAIGTPYEDGSILKLRKWLGVSEFVPSMTWGQDFVWQEGRPKPISDTAAHERDAEGQVVWHLEVAGGKSTVGRRISATEFRLDRFTDPGSRN